jgi:TolA-binding protein
MAPYAMYRIGFIKQIYLKDFKEGRKILEEVIRRNPSNADVRTEAYYGIALGYQEEGNDNESKEILKMLTQEYPASTAAMQAQGCLDNGECPL